MKEAESSFEKIFDTARIGTSSAAASDQDVVNAYLEIKNSVMAKKQEVFSPDKLKAILFDGARKGKEFSISEFTNGVETEVRFAGVTPEEIRKKVLQYIKDKNIT
jgi:hypothetical protein